MSSAKKEKNKKRFFLKINRRKKFFTIKAQIEFIKFRCIDAICFVGATKIEACKCKEGGIKQKMERRDAAVCGVMKVNAETEARQRR